MRNEARMRLTVEKLGPQIGKRTGIFWFSDAKQLVLFVRACDEFREIDAARFSKIYTTRYEIHVEYPLHLESITELRINGYNS